MSSSSPRVIPGLLPYTYLRDGSDSTSGRLLIFLWLDKKNSLIESTSFYQHIITPQGKDDISPLDTVCRGKVRALKRILAQEVTHRSNVYVVLPLFLCV